MLEARRREIVLGLGLAALALLAIAVFAAPAPRLVWNASASAPVGLYRVLPGVSTSGDLVFVRTPEPIRRFTEERGYLPADLSLIKRVVAVGGDTVCAEGDRILINDKHVATRRDRDGLGRPLPRWNGCRALGPNELFLLMEDVPDSFDGRYFGPIRRSAVIARLGPVWVR